MDDRIRQAMEANRRGTSCSGSVLCAFREELGLSEAEARRIASPMAGGAMGTCGAVLAADYIAEKKGMPKGSVSRAFSDKNGNSECRVIRRERLRSCNGCVEDASAILSDLLKDQK